MDVTPLIRRDAQVVQSYKGGIFKVSGQVYEHPVIVMPTKLLVWPDVSDFSLLAPFKDDIDFLLMGTGDRLIMPPPALKRMLKDEYGIVLEVMDTGAACRTYNVLLAEGRRIALALTA